TTIRTTCTYRTGDKKNPGRISRGLAARWAGRAWRQGALFDQLQLVQRRDRLEGLARGDVLRTRVEPVLRRIERVLHAVVDHEDIGARPRRDIAVGAVHGVAVEEHH